MITTWPDQFYLKWYFQRFSNLVPSACFRYKRKAKKRTRTKLKVFFFIESFNLQHFSNFLFRYQIENQKYQQTKSFKRTVSLQIEYCFQAIILKRNETPNTCQKW